LSIQYEVENERRASASITLKFDKYGEDIMKLIQMDEVEEEEVKPKGELIEEEYEKEIEEIDEKELEDREKQKEIEELEGGKEEPKKEEIVEIVDSVNIEIETPEGEEEIKASTFGFKTIAMYTTKAVGFCVQKIGSMDLSYSNTFRTKYYAPPDSLPDLSYQLGLRDQTFGQIQSVSQIDAFSANTRTRFELFRILSTELSAKYALDLNRNSGNKTKTESITLPGVVLSFSKIDELLKVKFLKGSNISTSFSRMISNTGSGFWETPDRTTEKFQFSPLLSFNTKLFNKINAKLGFNYNFSNQISYIENNKKTRTDESSVSATFRYSFQSAKGVKIPLLGRLNMTNKTDIDLDISYSASSSQSLNSITDKWDYSLHKNTMKIEPRVAYNFSRDINAGLTARYEASKDVKAGTSTTTTAINIWVEFKF